MNEDYGVDIDEVFKVIDSADVLVVRFHIIQKRLLVDFRTKPGIYPMLAVVERAESVEDRFRSIKRMRPEFGFPEKVMSFAWPRSIPVLIASGAWEHIVERVQRLGGDVGHDLAILALRDLENEEQREIVDAITGADHYQTLWERQRA
jgi:hypothetical protein